MMDGANFLTVWVRKKKTYEQEVNFSLVVIFEFDKNSK